MNAPLYGTAQVTVSAPARLHLGFLDPSGRFGSVGLAIDAPATLLTARRAPRLTVEGPDASRAEAIARRLLGHYAAAGSAHITIEHAIPEHAGLGSGTQLVLAIGASLAKLFGWHLAPRSIASIAGRGERSGIGIAAFETGGFLVDGGKGEMDEPPRIVARADFPSAWRVMLIFDRGGSGLHGEPERAAFTSLPAYDRARSAELCRLVLMQLLPALVEAKMAAFGAALGEMQRAVGDYFASVQGGRFASLRVGECLEWLESQGISAIGQSSWGPTGFAVVDSAARAARLAADAALRYPELDFLVCSGRNAGAEIRHCAGGVAFPGT